VNNHPRSGISRDLLVRGIAAAKNKDIQEAKFYLEWYLNFDPPEKERIDAYFYLALIHDGEEKRQFLENILALDPVDARARRELAILNGTLKVEQVIDPDRLPQESAKQQNVNGDRFICQTCGGRMSFAPDGQTLTCEFCEVQEAKARKEAGVEDSDFFIALATAKGHSAPQNTKLVVCEGCGARFIVPPKDLSWTCPYCESNYVEANLEEQDLVQPTAVIPFQISSKKLVPLLKEWQKEKAKSSGRFELVKGIYLPLWTFDIGGFVSWTVDLYMGGDWVSHRDEKSVFYDDLQIPATRKYAALLPRLFAGFNLRKLVPFETRYLASWMAESYDIIAGNAALLAREEALKRERSLIQALQLYRYNHLNISTARMTVDQYKLVLLPVWVVHYLLNEQHLILLVNGQTGEIIQSAKTEIEKEEDGLLSRFLDWLD